MRSNESPEPLLTAHALCKRYSGMNMVDNVSLTIYPREIITLIGPNGAGKTTLLKMLLGLVKPDSGTITKAHSLRIGYVPQHCHISPAMPMTLEGFLTIGHAHIGRMEIDNTLRLLAIEDIKHMPLHGLSGGQMRRTLIARALLSNPQLLVLDEPVAGVDLAGQGELYKRIRMIAAERGIAILMVSHDLFVVMAGSTRVLCLNHHLCCAGKPDHVGNHPEFIALFGPDVASQLATYVHHHDHHHSLHGEVIPGEHGEGCRHA